MNYNKTKTWQCVCIRVW